MRLLVINAFGASVAVAVLSAITTPINAQDAQVPKLDKSENRIKSNAPEEVLQGLSQFLGTSNPKASMPRTLRNDLSEHGAQAQALSVLRQWVDRIKQKEPPAEEKVFLCVEVLAFINRSNTAIGKTEPSPLEQETENLLWELAKLGGAASLAALPALEGARFVDVHVDDLIRLGSDTNREVRIWAGRILVSTNPRTGKFQQAIPMLTEMLNALLEQEQKGTAELALTPYFGVGYENKTRQVRGRLAELVAGYTVQGKLHLIQLFLEKDSVGAHRAVALGGLLTQYPVSNYLVPDSDAVPLYRRALKDHSAIVLIAALNGIRERHLASLADEVVGLASHHRQKVRQEAQAALRSLNHPVPSYEASAADWPKNAKKGWLEFAMRGLVDPIHGQRGIGAITKKRSWGDARRVTGLDGWGFNRGNSLHFLDDDQEEGVIPDIQNDFQPKDFDQELKERIEKLAQPESKVDSGQFPEPFWMGTMARDIFRMVWALRLNKEKEPRKMFFVLAQRFDSDEDMLDFAATELGWLFYHHALNSFSQADDKPATNYINRLKGLSPYAKPQQALSHYLKTGERVLQDISVRKSQATGAGSSHKKEDLISYWIDQLPEIRGRQLGQPGGVGIFTGIEPKVAEHLMEMGINALPALYEHFWDERLIRAVGFWRDFSRDRYIVTVGEAARMIFGAIVEASKVPIPDEFADADETLTQEKREWKIRKFRTWFQTTYPQK